MVDETFTEFGVGLSDEEKEDLENLIKGLKAEESVFAPGAALEDIQKQLRSTSEHLIQLGELLLKFDSRIKSLYEILRLSYQKSELMNKRIDSMIESIKSEKNVQPGSEH